jgi:hypothetical protein
VRSPRASGAITGAASEQTPSPTATVAAKTDQPRHRRPAVVHFLDRTAKSRGRRESGSPTAPCCCRTIGTRWDTVAGRSPGPLATSTGAEVLLELGVRAPPLAGMLFPS